MGDTGKVKAVISLNVILSGPFTFLSALGRATGSANHRLKDCAQFCMLLDLIFFFLSDSSRLSFLPLSMTEKQKIHLGEHHNMVVRILENKGSSLLC